MPDSPSDLQPTSATGPISVWHAAASSADAGPLERVCESWLEPDERERAARFRVATARHQHVVGRGMARRLLAGTGGRPQEIRFELLPHGKPIVRFPAAARRPFNVAHTDGLVVCGLGHGSSEWLGVDVERIDRRTDPALAERYFSPPEVDLLRGTRGEAARRERFLRIWTLKESLIKAIGTGLRTPLCDFAFFDVESEAPQVQWLQPELSHGRTWRFRTFAPRPGFIASLAIAESTSPPIPADKLRIELHRFEDWSLEKVSGTFNAKHPKGRSG